MTVTNQFKKEFVYDGANRLRIRREYAWSGGWTKTNETRFICDGVLPIQHRDSNNVPVLSLTRGLDLSLSLQGAGGIGGLLAMTESSGAHSCYHADGNGNVTALINTNQLLVARRGYGPYGATLSLSGPKVPVNTYWHSSQLYDVDTDFYHYPRRVYIPELCRFANHDPIGELGGLNLYGFVGNNPINFVDPMGLEITYYYGNNSFLNVSGKVPYLTGDTVIENLVSGAYNTIPLLSNTLDQLFDPIGRLLKAIAEGAGGLATQVTGMPEVGEGVHNVVAVLPFVLLSSGGSKPATCGHFKTGQSEAGDS